MLSSVNTSTYGRWDQDGGSYYSHFKFSLVYITETRVDKAYSLVDATKLESMKYIYGQLFL